MNEHVDKIIDLRRYLVLTEGKMDAEAQRAMTNIERQGNPWGLNRKERETWRQGDDEVTVPTVKKNQKLGRNSSIYSGLVQWDHTTIVVRRLRYRLRS